MKLFVRDILYMLFLDYIKIISLHDHDKYKKGYQYNNRELGCIANNRVSQYTDCSIWC